MCAFNLQHELTKRLPPLAHFFSVPPFSPQVMSSLPALENVFLRYTDTRGRLNCSMLDAAANLERLSLSGNTDLVGEIPGCFLQVRWLM
jgi:hypothetical protein